MQALLVDILLVLASLVLRFIGPVGSLGIVITALSSHCLFGRARNFYLLRHSILTWRLCRNSNAFRGGILTGSVKVLVGFTLQLGCSRQLQLGAYGSTATRGGFIRDGQRQMPL